MKLDAAREPVAITIESTGEPLAAVRVERTEGPSGRVSIRFENGAVVVSCGASTILELPSEPKRRLLPAADMPLVTIDDAEWHPATPTVTRVAVPIEAELLPPEDVARPRAPAAPRALDPGDAPTRIEYHPPSESAAPPPAGARAPSASPASSASPAPAPRAPGVLATKGPHIRRGVRRFALVAMLAASWMLWFHTYRSRHGHAPHAATRASAPSAPPPTAAGASSLNGKALAARNDSAPAVASSVARPVAVASPSVAAPAASTPAARASNVTEARAAADALANGDYASAVKLYDELASKPANNPAYAEVARSLRARAAPLSQ